MMRMSDAQQFYVVGVHGAPTPETAPHGVMYRHDQGDGDYSRWYYGTPQQLNDGVQWAPLPAPPTEQAPPPEPVARWTACNLGCGWSSLRFGPHKNHPGHEDATAAADALNTLDANGVAWGPGRPMQELPDGHEEYVLVAYTGDSGAPWSVAQGTTRANDVSSERLGWWPLPAPPTEEAPAPEPVARWQVSWDAKGPYIDANRLSAADAQEAADALNTLDATGIVCEPRPMSELPKAGRVLARHQNGGVYEREAKFLRLHGGPHWTGWYGPLPEVTP